MNELTRDSAEESSALGITWNYLQLFAASAIAYLLLSHFWGGHMVSSINQLMGHGLVWSGLARVWFIFVWGVVSTITLVAICQPSLNISRISLTVRGLWISLNAGVFEEFIYRVFGFLNYMVILTFLNWITFGFVRWFYVTITIPIVNFVTFHALNEQLTHHGWLLGAAILAAAISFSDDHSHNGLFGRVNSWFLGMVFFWLVFNYGLLTAIVAHVIYDALIFVACGLIAKTDR